MRGVMWTLSGLVFVLGSRVLAAHLDDYADLRGPYCEFRGCCNGREDGCAAPIAGTMCYCDDFCNQTRVDDCCPDYWTHCKGLAYPTTPRIPTTTRSPPENIVTCTYKGRNMNYNAVIKDNCNECKCERVGDRLEALCSTNACIVDQGIVQGVNDNSDYGWRAASNYSEFWARTLADGITYKLGTLQPELFVLRMNPVRRLYDPNSLPTSFDAHTKWPRMIGEVQDQGWCGSSWAISTAAVASDRYAILSKGIENVRLSAQNLVSCDTRGQESCKGGYLDRAWSFFRKFGLVNEECFPYVADNVSCRVGRKGNLRQSGCEPPSRVPRKSRYRVGPAYKLGNETDIMYEIIRSGPVQATLRVYHDFFLYQSGIYRHTDLASRDLAGYHSVRIVGWGEDYGYNGLQKYWKVANSWGPNWGEAGYFRIAKGINECDIESYVLATWPEIEKKVLYNRRFNEV